VGVGELRGGDNALADFCVSLLDNGTVQTIRDVIGNGS
jgi:hypothetical protein